MKALTHYLAEATWGADPLELNGGFRSLKYNDQATFRSSLAVNGTVAWSKTNATLSSSANSHSGAELKVAFPDIDWQGLREIYGWAALQWQAWARGEIIVHGTERRTLLLNSPSVLEYWIDGVHYFGGDFYGFARAGNSLRLEPGVHTIDVRLLRDTRAMGGDVKADIAIQLDLQATDREQGSNLKIQGPVLISDLVRNDDKALLASSYASVTVRNDGEHDIYLMSVEATHNACLAELVSKTQIKIATGQTRPIAFRIACVTSIVDAPLFGRITIDLKYKTGVDAKLHTISSDAIPEIRNINEPQKFTFWHPGGVVSYAILRPPSANVSQDIEQHEKLPVMLAFHGAGVEVDGDEMRSILNPLPDLRAFVLFPSGGTSWSGDDWHSWGFPDVEAAVAAIPDWIQEVQWKGPSVDLDKWLIIGHSNGGQGAWYALTHWPDKVLAAAPVSGYSSIQNYVPYHFWHPADPARTAVVQAVLNSYRHERLLSNAAGIPVLQQHGSGDDNVPVYHSRLLSQLIVESGADSKYVEMPDQPHWWDGIMTTEPLSDFYRQQLAPKRQPLSLENFKLVVANPGDTGSKFGLRILQLVLPGRVGSIDVSVDPYTRTYFLRLQNVRLFSFPKSFGRCEILSINGQELSNLPVTGNDLTLSWEEGTWHVKSGIGEQIPRGLFRYGRQLGNMDTILRTHGSFMIVRHSAAASRIALQISRNLCQYFAADTEIIDDFDSAVSVYGNVISVAIGDDFPAGLYEEFPIQFERNQIVILDDRNQERRYLHSPGQGLGAVFVRPLPLDRLELVVWGVDEASLDMAARLVPMMPGAGQPDFVIMDQSMMWKGIDGALAMGFFDNEWRVSRNSVL